MKAPKPQSIPQFTTEAERESHKKTLEKLIEGIKAELGDEKADMTAITHAGYTEQQKKDYLIDAINGAYEAGHMYLVLPEKPKVKFEFVGERLVAKPDNESALRIMQILNQAYFIQFAKVPTSGKITVN